MWHVLVVCKRQSQRVGAWFQRQNSFHLPFAKVNVLIIKRQRFFKIERQITVDQQMVVTAFAGNWRADGCKSPTSCKTKIQSKRRFNFGAIFEVEEISIGGTLTRRSLPGMMHRLP